MTFAASSVPVLVERRPGWGKPSAYADRWEVESSDCSSLAKVSRWQSRLLLRQQPVGDNAGRTLASVGAGRQLEAVEWNSPVAVGAAEASAHEMNPGQQVAVGEKQRCHHYSDGAALWGQQSRQDRPGC